MPRLHRDGVRGLLFRLLAIVTAAQLGVMACHAGEMFEVERDQTQAVVEPELVHTLLVWIGEHTKYDVGPIFEKPPSVEFCSKGDFIRYAGKTLSLDTEVLGVCDTTSEIITLVLPWNAGSTANVGTLLHELVHYVQFKSRYWVCPQETEWEAYKLQELWLKQQGTSFDPDWLRVHLLSRCTPRDIHPPAR